MINPEQRFEENDFQDQGAYIAFDGSMVKTFNYGSHQGLIFAQLEKGKKPRRGDRMFPGIWRDRDIWLHSRLNFIRLFLFQQSKFAPWKDEVFRWGTAVGGTSRHEWAPTYARLNGIDDFIMGWASEPRVYVCMRCMVCAHDEAYGSGPDARYDKFEEVSCDYLVVQKVLKE